MKRYFKYIAVLALVVSSCEPELENPIDEIGTYDNGEADFSNYVALGNSLTAGYADGALYLTGQQNSYPNILAQRFALTQEKEDFILPLVNDNTGGLIAAGQPIPGISNRLVLSVIDGDTLPREYTGAEPTTDIINTLEGPINNLGVPGAKSYHLLSSGYGDLTAVPAGTANPYFARFASSAGTSVLQDALDQDPTFFSLWIGNNDVLGYAMDGGTGTYQRNNTDPASYEENDITDPNYFSGAYKQMVDALTANGADGVLINIPDVTSSPFFTTVPNNALLLDAETAAGLTEFFQVLSQVLVDGLMEEGFSEEEAQAMAAQYAIEFEEGENRFIIDVPQTNENPLGFRQMTQEELILLTVDQGALRTGYGSVAISPGVMEVLGLLEQGERPNEEQVQILFNAVNGIDDGDALDEEELQNINDATMRYNEAISALSQANNLGLVDANNLLQELAEGGIPYDGGLLSSEFITGGAFSLDGLHLSPRGNATVANEIIDVINETYNADVPKVNVGEYATITYNNEVQ